MGSRTPRTDREAMAQRRQDTGLSYSRLGAEHGVSKSTAHRVARPRESRTETPMRTGFVRMGPAR